MYSKYNYIVFDTIHINFTTIIIGKFWKTNYYLKMWLSCLWYKHMWLSYLQSTCVLTWYKLLFWLDTSYYSPNNNCRVVPPISSHKESQRNTCYDIWPHCFDGIKYEPCHTMGTRVNPCGTTWSVTVLSDKHMLTWH